MHVSARQPVAEKLRLEIATFLAARQLVDVKMKDTTSPQDPKESCLRRCSLESIPEAVTEPQGSAFTDSHGMGVSKQNSSHNEDQEAVAFRARSKGHSPPGVQKSDPQNTLREIDARIIKTGEGTPTKISMLQKSDIYDSMKQQRKKAYDEEGHGSNSKAVDKLTSDLLSAGGSSHPSYEYKEVASSNSAMKRIVSPMRHLMASMSSPDPSSFFENADHER